MTALEAAHDLLRRMPISDLASSLDAVVQLQPDIADDLLEEVDQPLVVKKCPVSGKDFVCGPFNMDGDSFRSPWSNTFLPPNADGTLPSAAMRTLEVAANEVFAGYRDAYFEGGGVSSAYFWEDDSSQPACAVYIKKSSGTNVWDSTHVVSVLPNQSEPASKRFTYKLTSTVLISTSNGQDGSPLTVSGSISRCESMDAVATTPADHVANIGDVIQTLENRMLDAVFSLYFGKCSTVTTTLHSSVSNRMRRGQAGIAAELTGKLKAAS